MEKTEPSKELLQKSEQNCHWTCWTVEQANVRGCRLTLAIAEKKSEHSNEVFVRFGKIVANNINVALGTESCFISKSGSLFPGKVTAGEII